MIIKAIRRLSLPFLQTIFFVDFHLASRDLKKLNIKKLINLDNSIGEYGNYKLKIHEKYYFSAVFKKSY